MEHEQMTNAYDFKGMEAQEIVAPCKVRACGCNTIYKVSGGCTNCFQLNQQPGIDHWGEPGQGSPSEKFPDSVPVAKDQGLSWWSNRHATACPRGPHLLARHITTGRCVGCTGDKNDPNRAKAQANGESTYYPTFACPKCNTHLRRVSSNRCVKCNPAKPRERSKEQALMEDDPLTIVTLQQAYLRGLKVYRTSLRCKRGHKGWRYVANSACLDCIKGVKESNQEYSEEKRPEEIWMRSHNRAIITRNESIQSGFKLYKTSRPCKYGHLGFRRVVGGACVDCQRGLKAEDWDDLDEIWMRKHPTGIMSREMAQTLGLRVYRTGEPFMCDHGIGWRYLENANCVDCTKGGLRTPPKHKRNR